MVNLHQVFIPESEQIRKQKLLEHEIEGLHKMIGEMTTVLWTGEVTVYYICFIGSRSQIIVSRMDSYSIIEHLKIGGSGKGWWCFSKSPQVHKGMRNAWFEKQKLIKI